MEPTEGMEPATSLGEPPPGHPLAAPPTVRRDAQNRVLCGAHRTNGEECNAPAMKGQRVCRTHGGSSGQARRKAAVRLAELVDPAIATLAREMVQADRSNDRQRAANSILDRAGYGRTSRVESADARDLLAARLLELREAALLEQQDDYEEESEDA